MQIGANEWIAVDWGTSNLRLWVMDGAGQARLERSSDQGMGCLRPDQFEPALMALIHDLLPPSGPPVPVICAGMVGAKQGWSEAPYVPVPAAPFEASKVIEVIPQDGRIRVRILPGMSQAKPADVMRGEETQVAGYLADHPHWDGVLCLPGTHSKWVHASAGEVVSFQTFMTGELFALLSEHSVLRHSVHAQSEDESAFFEALETAMDRPERASAALFSLRAQDILHGSAPGHARAALSGILLGLELAAAKPYWLGRDIVIIGAQALAERYQSALEHVGMQATCVEASGVIGKGLFAAYRCLGGKHVA